MEQVDITPLNGSRYFNTMATQRNPGFGGTGADEGLPMLSARGPADMAPSYDMGNSYPAGSQTDRPMRGGNTYFQRMSAGKPSYQPDQFALGPGSGRPCYEPTRFETQQQVPSVYVDGMRNRFYVDPGPPVFRSGRLGAPWRHIRQCTGNLGNHICFVEGLVKQNDMTRFPPYGFNSPGMQPAYKPPNMAASGPAMGASGKDKYANVYSSHARKGFKYWTQDRPLGGGHPKQTIQGRLMKLGVGY